MFKGFIIRNFINKYPKQDPRLTFGIANTNDEKHECFSVIYKAYLDKEWVKPNDEKIRTIPQQLNPDCIIMYAKFAGKIVGTVTLIPTKVGVQFSKYYSVRIPESSVEVCCLAIEKGFRRKNGINVIFPLVKFVYQYALNTKISYLYNMIRPKDLPVYENTMMYRQVKNTQEVDTYGAKSILVRCHVTSAYKRSKILLGKTKNTIQEYLHDTHTNAFNFTKG